MGSWGGGRAQPSQGMGPSCERGRLSPVCALVSTLALRWAESDTGHEGPAGWLGEADRAGALFLRDTWPDPSSMRAEDRGAFWTAGRVTDCQKGQLDLSFHEQQNHPPDS